MSRLIDAEALKKKCAEVVKASNNSDFIPCPTWNNAMELIDNAPTVNLNETQIQEILNKRSMTAVANEYLSELHGKRPMGHWTVTETGNAKCPCDIYFNDNIDSLKKSIKKFGGRIIKCELFKGDSNV